MVLDNVQGLMATNPMMGLYGSSSAKREFWRSWTESSNEPENTCDRPNTGCGACISIVDVDPQYDPRFTRPVPPTRGHTRTAYGSRRALLLFDDGEIEKEEKPMRY